jgi:hypothetical protein
VRPVTSTNHLACFATYGDPVDHRLLYRSATPGENRMGLIAAHRVRGNVLIQPTVGVDLRSGCEIRGPGVRAHDDQAFVEYGKRRSWAAPAKAETTQEAEGRSGLR